MSDNFFEYYKEILPQSERWHDVVSDQLPITFWVNTLKTTPEKVQEYLREDGIIAEPIAWHDSAFRVPRTHKLGRHWTYLSGLIQIQEEVSMLSGRILQPNPGEKVLDLCAAPGNKTAQMAVAMNNQGTLIANDPNYQRMRALSQIMKRLGLINISMTLYDGGSFTNLPDFFDKIMVDAPCSCEGTLRKSSRKSRSPNRNLSLSLAKTQIHLLSKAIKLCKPGGQILYSTCTFAPEENESVINEILKTQGDSVRIIPIKLPQFELTPGITEWRGEQYHPEVAKTSRVWPHLNDTGGFYLALFEKIGTKREMPIAVKSLNKPTNEISDLIDKQCQRFGIDPQKLSQYHFSAELTARGIYMINTDNTPPEDLRYDMHGLFFLKTQIKYPKLSTAAVGIFGPFATRNRVDLTNEQREIYCLQQDVQLTESQVSDCSALGYVILFYKSYPIGIGLLSSDNKTLKSCFPKHLYANTAE